MVHRPHRLVQSTENSVGGIKHAYLDGVPGPRLWQGGYKTESQDDDGLPLRHNPLARELRVLHPFDRRHLAAGPGAPRLALQQGESMSPASYSSPATCPEARSRGWAVTDESARACERFPPNCSAAHASIAEWAKVNRRDMRCCGRRVGIVPGQSRLRFDDRPSQCGRHGRPQLSSVGETPDPDAGHVAFRTGLARHGRIGGEERLR